MMERRPLPGAICLVGALLVSPPTIAGSAEEARFKEIREIVSENFFDEARAGEPWRLICETHESEAARAEGDEEFAEVMAKALAALGASHTAYYGLDDVRRLEIAELFSLDDPALNAERNDEGVIVYNTIGVALVEIDGRVFIDRVHAGSTGAAAGLRVGDELVTIDGRLPTEAVILGAEPGEEIVVEYRRSGPDAPVRSARVGVESIVPSELFLRAMREGARMFAAGDLNIGYVPMWSYAGLDFQDALIELATSEPLSEADGLIVDLRGGWGGAMPDYLSFFDVRPPSLKGVPRDGEPYTHDPHWRKPAALLVDEDSRSGKEVMAYGFKKHGIGPIIGARTGAAVLGGRPYVLSNGAILYLAVHDVEVDGKRLEGVGVDPDVAVERPIPFAAGHDPQLDAAIETLADRIREGV